MGSDWREWSWTGGVGLGDRIEGVGQEGSDGVELRLSMFKRK